MSEQHISLDEMDTLILEILQKDCRTSLGKIANELGVPKSTVHYRIKRLEAEEIIVGYHAKVDATKLGKDYATFSLIRAKYGPGYHEKVGKRLSEIPGVWAVYFILGENDFVILARSDNREDFMNKLEKVIGMQEIERSNTAIIAKVIKEDPRIQLKASMHTREG